jgi:hypothetical protein
MKEYYSRLFLKDGSSLEEVKKAYRKLVKKFHPDKNAESNEYTEEFKLIQEAYVILVAHLTPNKDKQTSNSTVNEESVSGSSDSGIVKSSAKFAGAGETQEIDKSLQYALQPLIAIFLICCVFAIMDSNSLIFQIALSVSVASYIVAYFFGKQIFGSASSETSSAVAKK